MTGSPTRHGQLSAQSQLPPVSPRSPGKLRKLQSAHQLSSHYASGPSLISQQRQQQQRSTANLREPPVPAIPAHHSPSRRNRTRSNSDASLPALPNPTSSPRKLQLPRKVTGLKDPKHELESLIRHGPREDVSMGLQNLRHWILCDGLVADNDGMSQLRIYAWLILLNAPPISTDAYLALTRRGPSSAHTKICNDTFRTFKTNPLFKRRVTENSLIRLLNATAWTLSDANTNNKPASGPARNASTELGSPELKPSKPAAKGEQVGEQIAPGAPQAGTQSGIYVQGMNVLCAPFLYVARSEAEAFVAFHRFVTRDCPGYLRGAMDGVHKGVTLVDRCLAVVDPKLSTHLLERGVRAEVYAFASVLTLCAGTPPLQEVLHLWDFLFAYGAHLNILCICAQLINMKESLLSSTSPGLLLQNLPALDAKRVIMLTVALVPKIPDELYGEVVDHAR